VFPLPESACADARAEIDISQFPADFVDEVIVPVPSEIFSVLDKLGQPNWKAEVHRGDNAALKERYELALQFGVVVANGFIAVQAEDKIQIQKLGGEVMRLAIALGVREPVAKHAQSISDNAEADNYTAVRAELDRTQRTVRMEMEAMRDEEIAQLVSIGGWLRGTDVVTGFISKDYSKEKAELLYQPDLVEHFEKSILKMGEKVRGTERMKAITKGLAEIRVSMRATVDEMIPVNAVHDIHETCSGLVEMIVKGDKEEKKGS